jgi:hypothetical protein
VRLILSLICAKSWNLKFDTLLAQYLYQHKKLNLPGIGTFEADASVGIPDENEKQKASLEGITYRSVRILQPDDDLIDFIKAHTGKMKPLALSDLEDYLALGKQFLNIGKPFFIEGIGTLKLTKDGKYEFAPGAYVTTKLEDPLQDRQEGRGSSYREERTSSREDGAGNGLKKTFLVIGILGSLALIGWAGYYLYTLNTTQDNTSIQPQQDNGLSTTDSSNAAVPGDSLQPATTPVDSSNMNKGQYKFVVERTTKARALRRYEDLKSFGSKIQMEATDSVNYKLFYLLPATSRDTLRMRDSLNRWYYGNTKKIRVTVE